ncbi:MAG: hypothetical protein IJJ99_07400 [Oscillospiraceae bacterium]|nr:hypothetical protein [Oscillospiraceae bacterium]
MPSVLDAHLAGFITKCDWALQVYYGAVSLYNENNVAGFSADMKNMIIENLILNVCSSWEKFLEDIFIAYLLGSKSENGSAVVSYVSPKSNEHAYNLIKSVNTYPDWADINKILINAENFFEGGGSFKILKTLSADINAIKKIRNAIAHTSKKAREDFENLVRGKVGHLPVSITPAIFVTDYKIGNRRTDPTYFEYYVEFLKDSATMLVEYNPNTGV